MTPNHGSFYSSNQFGGLASIPVSYSYSAQSNNNGNWHQSYRQEDPPQRPDENLTMEFEAASTAQRARSREPFEQAFHAEQQQSHTSTTTAENESDLPSDDDTGFV